MSKLVSLKDRLDAKKYELQERQKDFLVLTEMEMNSDFYEQNAINELIKMMRLKSEISELEFLLK